MDAAAVQILVDAALAAAAVTVANQQQAAIDTAVVAAMAASQPTQAVIDAAIAAASGTTQRPPPTSGFSLTPGLANPTAPWNYNSSEGIKLYFNAVAALSLKYKGDERSLKVFLSGLTAKARQFGIMEMTDSAGVQRNLLKHYTLLTLADVQKHGVTYTSKESRSSQASSQLASCIMSSLDGDSLLKC
jgi:hypothetical protein